MEPEGPIPCSYVQATEPYLQAQKFSVHSYTTFP
jgi:hypothetical protein